jgi:hypothetical protein
MYPVLVVAGGTITLAFDYRLDALAYVRQKRRNNRKSRASTAIATEPVIGRTAQDDVELAQRTVSRDDGSDSKDEAISPAPLASQQSNPKDDLADRSSLRQRGAPPTPAATPPRTTAAEEEAAIIPNIMTPSTAVAVATGITLLVTLIAVLVTRSKLNAVPRSFDFFCNMMIAGVIIFGGGPVVIPLLKGYTVDPGTS